MRGHFRDFLNALTTELGEFPLREFFPVGVEYGDVRNFADEVLAHCWDEFLRFADGSSAPNGDRFDSFDSKISVGNSPAHEKMVHSLQLRSTSKHSMNISPKALTAPAIAILSEMISAFRENLKTCLCSDDVKFFCPGRMNAMASFREQFANTANAWLDSEGEDPQSTRRDELARLRESYDIALKAFQSPLAEERTESQS
jgi:hypothetical protein